MELNKNKKIIFILTLFFLVILMTIICLFAGSSRMTIKDCFLAFAKKSTPAYNRIIWNIRIPRVLAALIAGAGLSVSGLIMQTNLNNPMASPSTLGVSNAAVFGANICILAGFSSGFTFYAASFMAFIFSLISILFILGLCKIRAFSPTVVILAGLAIGSIWTAATTILQFYSEEVGISAAVIWNFGDLGRATYKSDLFMFIVVTMGTVLFVFLSWKYNALLSGDITAKTLGINIERVRFLSLLLASMITAVCISFLGIIGFVGIICPHIVKKIIGQDHRFTIPASVLSGSLLLLIADTLSRTLGNGSALPVGAITSLMGAPFFIAIIFSKKGAKYAEN